jgi:hypothetical protein
MELEIYLSGAIPCDQCDFSCFLALVDDCSTAMRQTNAARKDRRRTVQQLNDFICFHTGPDFDPNRISYTSEILDMCAVDLTRPITDPQEVGRRVIKCLLFLRMHRGAAFG